MPKGPKVAILGAGSVGCFIGGAWASAGIPVTFIGRPKLAKDIGQHGLTLTDYDGWEMRLPARQVDFRCGPEGLSEASILALTAKSGATAAAVEQISRHATPGALVISFQNGITNVEVLNQALHGRFDVARGMVAYNVAYLGEGRFHKGVAGDLFVERRDELGELVDAAANGPAALRFSDDMLGLAWGKLLINLNNAVNALSGRTLRDELKQREYRRVFAASMREGLDLLKRAGIEPAAAGPISPRAMPRIVDTPDWLFNSIFMKRWKIDAKARSSMADDLAAGRKTEVDYLNGELMRLADRLQRAAPVNRAIVELVHKAEAGANPLSGAAMRKAVLGR